MDGDSITLAQLKQFVEELPRRKSAPVVNARYAERPALITLLNDFFDGVNERRALQRAATVLARDTSDRAIRVIILVDELESADLNVRLQSLEQLRALLLGLTPQAYDAPVDVQALTAAITASSAVLIEAGIIPSLESELDALEPPIESFLIQTIAGISAIAAPRHFPLKKLLLLAHAVLIQRFGEMDKANEMKDALRRVLQLPAWDYSDPMRPKCTPQELAQYESDLALKYAGYIPEQNHHTRLRAAASAPTATAIRGMSPAASTMNCVPAAIDEAVVTLRKHLYVSIGSVHLYRAKRDQFDISVGTRDNHIDPNGNFWQPGDKEGCLTRLTSILSPLLVVLLKIMLAVATPLSQKETRAPTNTQSVVCLVLMMLGEPGQDVMSTMDVAKSEIQFAHAKDIVAQTVSSLVLCLLKHTRRYHELAYETVSQVLVESNGILLILKVLSRDCNSTLLKSTDIADESFLQLARAEASVAVSAIVQASTPEAQNAGGLSTAQNPEAPHDDSVDVNVRNFATVINAVRILQKLVKRRPERIATLLKFKAVNTLKKLVRVNETTSTRYALKVIRCILPFLGRKWRQSNMAIVTAIQSSLRPSLLESSAASAASEAEGEEKPDSIEALSTSSNDKTLRELTSRFSRMVSLEALEG